MEGYYEIKEKHPDYLLIFRKADFCEMYENDATIASKVLNIDIKKHICGDIQTLMMIRFPCNELDNYLTKLILSGIRLALCE